MSYFMPLNSLVSFTLRCLVNILCYDNVEISLCQYHALQESGSPS